MRRYARPLAFLLIAAQLLLAVPAMASARIAQAAAPEIPCAGMATAGGDHHCPCCPDGVDSMSDCLASCLLAVAAAPAVSVVHVIATGPVAFIDPGPPAGNSSDPPLKPPPIR